MEPKMTAADTARFLGVSLQAVHKQLRGKALAFAKAQNRVFFGFETARHLFGPVPRNRIVAFQIVKGGTGKTSLAHSFAVRANLYGAKVLCVDLDQQGNFTQACKVDPEAHPCMVDVIQDDMPVREAIVSVGPGFDLLPSRIENSVLDNAIMLKRLPLDRVYRDRFDSLRDDYDLIVVDCPPAIGQSVAAVALATDLVVAPVTPEKFCLSGLKITTREIQTLEATYHREIPVKIVLNKHDNRTVLSHEVLSALVKHPVYGDMLFKSYIRSSQEFPNAIAKGQSVFDSLRDTPAKEDADLLTREILEFAAPESPAVSLGSLGTPVTDAAFAAAR
jgi:chromosome partitioning protein